MWFQWLPWRMAVRRLARKAGFLDPFNFIEQLERFAQPSEVAVPLELVRLASVLHARGLINSQAIQHNLDWVWPYWVQRQFDPDDISFIPRAFSISHINLTHRNWTAIGIPDCPHMPIVDPAGLVTPHFDAWSIDVWIVDNAGKTLVPSRLQTIRQTLVFEKNLTVRTESSSEGFKLVTKADVVGSPQSPVCRIGIEAHSERPAWAVLSLRPYNPEGVSFIHQIESLDGLGWKVNGKFPVCFNDKPERCIYSDYKNGDVFHLLPLEGNASPKTCAVGLATAAALYSLQPGQCKTISVEIPLTRGSDYKKCAQDSSSAELSWKKNLEGTCEAKIPDPKFQFLYDAAMHCVLLHAPAEVYPGPYTYKHFWFRDAAFILQAMLSVGFITQAKRVIDTSFFQRQNPFGYFHSQDGEWDSNGQALWSLRQYCRLSGEKPPQSWKSAVEKGARWILKKRTPEKPNSPHAGLLPPGFSAEHLGPNDYYYWDNFWGIAGLQAAADLEMLYGDVSQAAAFKNAASQYCEDLDRSLKKTEDRLGFGALPASPYRRMDSGAIGSIAGGYPLQLWGTHDPRLLETIDYLLRECSVHGGFFHDMSHSGINPYLTLHIAQTLLRAGDPRFYPVMKSVADLASPTGQWPEAVHPRTKGGCMGDGQHIWAAAEWILMMRSLFVREEEDKLILFSGIIPEWQKKEGAISFGPTQTRFGTLEVSLEIFKELLIAKWNGRWVSRAPEIEVSLPGLSPVLTAPGQNQLELRFSAVPS